MKKILFFLALLISSFAFGQSIGYWRYDTVMLQKIGGNSELNILNGTRSVTNGVLTNVGNGRTRFVLPTGSTNTNVGVPGFNIGVEGTNNIKRLRDSTYWKLDSSIANTLRGYIDTAALFTRVRLTLPVTGANNGDTVVAGLVGRGGNLNRNTFILNTNNFDHRIQNIKKIGFNVQNPTAMAEFDGPGVRYLNQVDTNGIILANYTATTLASDSFITPAITYSVNAFKQTNSSSQNIRFRTDVVAVSAFAGGSAEWQISAYPLNSSTYSTIFRITNAGIIQDNLNLFVHKIGAAGPTTNTTSIRFGTLAVNSANNAAMTGADVVGIGVSALRNNTTGFQLVAIGSDALRANTTGNYNTAIGAFTLSTNTTAIYNTAIGSSALNANTSGFANTAVGKNSFLFNTTGEKNTGLGAGSGEANTTGSNNTYIGEDAGLQGTTGGENVGVGWLGWSQNRTGIRNVGVGSNSGQTVVNGNYNTAVGYSSMNVAGQEDTVRHSIAIGANTFTTKSYQMVLGNDSLTETKIFGITNAPGTRSLRIDPATNIITYGDTATGSGATPTLQQVLTAGSTLNVDNTINAGSEDFTISNADIITLSASPGIFLNAGSTGEITAQSIFKAATLAASVEGSVANDGGIYYDNVAEKFRAHQNGSWIDMIAGGAGTVTNVATGYGLSGGPITTTGTLLLDSANIKADSTKAGLVSAQIQFIRGPKHFLNNAVGNVPVSVYGFPGQTANIFEAYKQLGTKTIAFTYYGSIKGSADGANLENTNNFWEFGNITASGQRGLIARAISSDPLFAFGCGTPEGLRFDALQGIGWSSGSVSAAGSDILIQRNATRQMKIETRGNTATNTILYPLMLKNLTSSTAAIGYGVGQEFGIENASGTEKTVGRTDYVFTDATNATEDVDYVLSLMDAGTLTEALRVDSDGKPIFRQTITTPGTTGNQTINKPSGRVNIAAAGTTITVTNSTVTANSSVFAICVTGDATAYVKNTISSAGSFVINLGAATTSETAVFFFVVNN